MSAWNPVAGEADLSRYLTNGDLPLEVRLDLPPSAQNLFRFAYNDAWQQHANHPMRRDMAIQSAWDVVKKRFRKQGGEWLPIDCSGKPV